MTDTMEIGVALPQMARDYGPRTTVEWSRAIDDGPFSSVSAGERVTFSNPEMVASLAAAAAVTRRVRIMANVWVLPAHPVAMVAQQVGTLDQLAPGRISLGVGVGGREDDYRALGAPLRARHARLDTQVAELRRLLAGEPSFPGADPVGPALTGAVPQILAAAMGPKSMNRAARWADGITGFTVTGRRSEMESTNRLADEAWSAADRTPPRKVTGCFVAVGVDDPAATLRDYVSRYLAFAGEAFASAMAEEVTVCSPDAVDRLLDDAEAAGCDELILVPATADRRCLDALEALVSGRGVGSGIDG